MIDLIDQKIIGLLQKNARLSNAEIGDSVGINPSSVFERVKKLERKGVITGYVATVDPDKLGKSVLAFIRLTVAYDYQSDDESYDRMMHVCLNDPDILECHHVAGEDCFIVKVRAGGSKQLEKLLDKIRRQTRSLRSVTSIVLSSFKETTLVEPYHSDGGENETGV